jgi:hypothetical protein
VAHRDHEHGVARRNRNWIFGLMMPGMLLLAHGSALSQEPSATPGAEVFSGPQVGESLPPLTANLVLEEEPATTEEAAKMDAEHPHRMIIFVHQLTRPSIAYTRILGEYAATRKADGLETSVVFLGADATELAASVRRAKGALPKNVLVGISPDGLEGPGSYGLNRSMTLTVLLASRGNVTFNAALVDPSIPVELPKALEAICKLAGGDPPTVESLMGRNSDNAMMRGRPAANSPKEVPNDQVPGFSKVEPLIRRFIRKENTDEMVDDLAKQIEGLLEDAPEAKQRVKEIAGRVYKIYGTDRAKFHLRRWAGVDEAPAGSKE